LVVSSRIRQQLGKLAPKRFGVDWSPLGVARKDAFD
jgi:hypothetical protein